MILHKLVHHLPVIFFTQKMNCVVLPLLLFHCNYHSSSVLTQNSLPGKQQTRHSCCPKGMQVCGNSLCQDFTFINVEPYLAALWSDFIPGSKNCSA